jgi:hypothetical protein
MENLPHGQTAKWDAKDRYWLIDQCKSVCKKPWQHQYVDYSAVPDKLRKDSTRGPQHWRKTTRALSPRARERREEALHVQNIGISRRFMSYQTFDRAQRKYDPVSYWEELHME